MSYCSQRGVRDPKWPRGLHFPPHRGMEKVGLGSLSAAKYKTESGVLVIGAEVTAYNW